MEVSKSDRPYNSFFQNGRSPEIEKLPQNGRSTQRELYPVCDRQECISTIIRYLGQNSTVGAIGHSWRSTV
ncbi:hypothetical protein [Microcoleus sp. herbarium12]|uniref:hypothetical protein n=1 Tax=Microcoleus sp. herbarium12 TaxID=3055437 RepID=UPI002FCF7CA9